ncbi:DUF2690 domain-containing protein [Streptomyces sp. NPDC058092]|uniref:DUF2690 domain-containing protein n=1 Tax=Streptomyces sp. NPDC058092 TaxID=3346336 RepID=UPI0036EC5A91
MRLTRATFSAAVLATGLVFAALPATAHAASAAPQGGCWGSSCTGKDPAAYCAGDAYTVHSARIGQTAGVIELRYSPSCEAAWARITGKRDIYNAGAPKAKVIRNDGRTYSCEYSHTNGNQTSCYTNMVNDHNFTSYAWGWFDNGIVAYSARTASY